MMAVAATAMLGMTSFLAFIHALSRHERVKINLMSIKFRSVHTDELRLSSDRNTASAAHSGPVHHNRIQRGDCRDLVFLRQGRDEFHHDGRTDRDAQIHLFTVDHTRPHAIDDVEQHLMLVVDFIETDAVGRIPVNQMLRHVYASPGCYDPIVNSAYFKRQSVMTDPALSRPW